MRGPGVGAQGRRRSPVRPTIEGCGAGGYKAQKNSNVEYPPSLGAPRRSEPRELRKNHVWREGEGEMGGEGIALWNIHGAPRRRLKPPPLEPPRRHPETSLPAGVPRPHRSDPRPHRSDPRPYRSEPRRPQPPPPKASSLRAPSARNTPPPRAPLPGAPASQSPASRSPPPLASRRPEPPDPPRRPEPPTTPTRSIPSRPE
ncbi:hypothetical protein GUJ93_ZPchr0008g12940 [Zizania palustris]|uniref:Uncharacterized protein n=1 Tax=Zizania palustris TaxID=103762 RepID=A0A8J5RZC6_ZIZPA|nr:hypothetical protein GUJ93_ZPchr0008g12940 [Zizania palustris]